MDGVVVREETHSDWPKIFAVHASAFPSAGEAKLVDVLRADGDLVVSLVAARDERIVGHVAFSRMHAPFRALGLGPVGVLPEFHNQGVGGALIRDGLARATALWWEAVFVLGDPGYYERFGFRRDIASGFTCRYAGPHFMAIALSANGLPQPSGDVAYAPSFETVD
jgi:putative acetyltransferase